MHFSYEPIQSWWHACILGMPYFQGSMVMEGSITAPYKASNAEGSGDTTAVTMPPATGISSVRTPSSPGRGSLSQTGASTRTAMAYKRPLVSAGNGYSQSSVDTPPTKMIATQGLRGSRPVPLARYDLNMNNLTPPHTPDVYY